MYSFDLPILIFSFLFVFIIFLYFSIKLYRKRKLYESFFSLSRHKPKKLVDKLKEKYNSIARIARMLEILRLDITLLQYLLISAFFGLLGMILIYFLLGYPTISIFGAFGCLLPYLYVTNKEYKRKKEINQQFAPMIRHLSNYLKAGNNFRQAVEKTALVTEGELGISIEHIVKSINGGQPIALAIEQAEEYIPIIEYKMFHILVSIHNDMGGDLAESLNNLADVIDKKKVLRDEIDAITQETRVSAYITAVIPTIIFGVLKVSSPEYLAQIERLPFGKAMMIGSFFFIAFGVFIVKKMSAIKVDKSYR